MFMESDYLAISLTQGQVALISAEDADLAQFRWFAVYYPKLGRFYAKRNTRNAVGKLTTVYLHRVIMQRMTDRPLTRADEVDHIERLETLDNRRSNLRLATKSENMHNMGATARNISGYKGVSYHKATGLWRARITEGGKERNLGYFHTPIEAAHAYDEVIEKLHGEFAYKNFA